jgi:outer membrane protein assembly factor BamB
MPDQDSAHPACDRHPELNTVTQCSHCGKPICRECITEFGYFCSKACQDQVRASITPEERKRRQEEEIEEQELTRKVNFVMRGILAVCAIIVAVVVWRAFIRPAGKICWTWECDAELSDIKLVEVNDQTVTALVGNRLVQLKTGNGKLLQDVSLDTEIDVANAQIKLTEEQLVLYDNSQILVLDRDGKAILHREFDGYQCAIEVADDLSHAWYVMAPPAYAMTEDSEERRCRLTALDLASGEEKWVYQPEKGFRITKLLTSGKTAFSLESHFGEGKVVFCAINPATGKPAWRLSFDALPDWGPHISGGYVALHYGGSLQVLSLTGQEKWSLPIPDDMYPDYALFEELLFMDTDKGTKCLQLNDGKELWESVCRIRDSFLFTADDRLYATGSVPDEDFEKNKHRTPGFGEMESILKEMGGEGVSLGEMMRRPALLCLGRWDGKELWNASGVTGDVFGDTNRLVNVFDTSESSVIEIMTGGKGAVIVQQFDPTDGERLYRRQLEIGFAAGGVGGKRLIGVLFERREMPGLLNMSSNAGSQENLFGLPKATGISAIRLR